MTTYEGITTCEIKHREFFTDRARLNLMCYLDLRGRGSVGDIALAKAGFKSNMRERRLRTYLEAA